MTFYDSLNKAMEEKGITAAELSRRTGFHQSYFSSLKKGDCKDVTWERALVIIEALDMTPSEFATLGEQEEDTDNE